MKKLTSLVLATGMVLSLAACGGSGSSTAASTTNTGDSTATTDTAAADESNLGYEYGEHFHSDEPVTYTMFFNDNLVHNGNEHHCVPLPVLFNVLHRGTLLLDSGHRSVFLCGLGHGSVSPS